MNEVIEAFNRQMPVRHKRTGRGWITFDCPACGDRRGRGGFLETPTGGFRYRCMNGGCRYEQKTGWEPGTPFLGRPRRLFELLGGSISDIPLKYIEEAKPEPLILSGHDWTQWWLSDQTAGSGYKPSTDKVALNFPELKLPKDSKLVWDCTTPDGLAACRYWEKRCATYAYDAPFMWSPRYKEHIIVPFLDNHKCIGWIARKIYPGKEFAHIKCPRFPTDYMYNQHMRFRYKDVLVVQGVFDAIAMKALCTFGSVITKKQTALLNQLAAAGKRIVLVPDYKNGPDPDKGEWFSYLDAAKTNGWSLSVPDWPGDDGYSQTDYIKDPGDSIDRNGRLRTIEVLMDSITDNYTYAETMLISRSR